MTTYTPELSAAIHARAVSFGLTGKGHVAVRLAAAGMIDHLDGWEGFEAASDELDDALVAAWPSYADIMPALVGMAAA